LGELRALRRLRAGHDDQKVMFERNAAFQRLIPGKEIANSSAVIGFDTSSWLLAEKTVALGRRFILDQSAGHPLSIQTLMPRLREEFPEWAEDFSPRLPELLHVEELEHQAATWIVVASSFSRRTLIENGVPAEKIVLNPYGVDLAAFAPVPRPEPSRPLRFVFVGSFSAGKGVPLLLQAWRSLKATGAELWLAGPHSKRHVRLIPELPGLRVVGKVPHRELPALLRQCDVLVLPSYFEGFGLVLLEALAAGMPIIASDATAAPDLITAGVEGYLVPVGDVDALREAMKKFVDSPKDLASMTQAARSCAERYSWDAYGNRWVELLHQVA
jgi:glycosyltransferase involved in cell wall biosynthesis